MSYNKEMAERKLDGSELDQITLNEREQRHILVDGYHGMPSSEYIELRDAYIKAVGEIQKMQQWVNDLQSGMYVNCVYCGHRYGPADEVPVSMAEVLKQHVEQCPKHPMSKLRDELEGYRAKDEERKATEYHVEAFGSEAKHIIDLLKAEADGRIKGL